MVKPWHVLADDLTGALDSAAAWADAGEVTGAPSPLRLQ